MSIFKAILTDLTASKRKKVSIHMDELMDEALTAIHGVETQLPMQAKEIALGCRRIVLVLPRGEEGYEKAYKLYYDFKHQGSHLHASAWIASRLILADHVVARAGGDGLPSMTGITLIQGYIEGFFERHGVPRWKAQYYERSFFDDHRDEISRPESAST